MVEHAGANKVHLVLVNKKSGKVASSNTWLLALAAHAQILNDTSGIAGLLPQKEALKSLEKNTISVKTIRGLKGGKLTEDVRNQAKAFLPRLADLFIENPQKNKSVTRTYFCSWITQQLAEPSSEAYNAAISNGLEDLIFSPRSVRWWMGQLEKTQS
ncbi:hypothetical protein [Octadecabacter arcticus]|uniref:hypothetical protein n=1 Tax=Octadecabacter arcticus TaxID=53946 RepID=UPI0005C46D01|nr:hypothetical protein [Octadecabacter arcticus]